MRKRRFIEEQIIMALRQADAGTRIAEIRRKLEITESTFHRWRQRFGGLGVSDRPVPRGFRQSPRSNLQGGGPAAGAADGSHRGVAGRVGGIGRCPIPHPPPPERTTPRAT